MMIDVPITNPAGPPPGWDTTYAPFPAPFDQPWVTGSLLPCGCYQRRGDFEAILCEQHLAELNDRGPR